MSDKKFFIGIDSDGTAFDSMTIKHTDSFIPAMFSVWGMEGVRERAAEIEERKSQIEEELLELYELVMQ